MTDPTLEAIRHRVANASSVLAHLHYGRDLRFMIDQHDAHEARFVEYERLLVAASAAVDELTRQRRSLEARLDAVLKWRDHVQDTFDGWAYELPYEAKITITVDELDLVMKACPEVEWAERVVLGVRDG